MMTDTSPKYSGEPTAEALANGLATLGRYGDNYMVHAAEGETLVPKEILEANPGLKEDLFRQMTMMGIEDPNRYVVGNELNSINPITGQPEFFFKKVFKAIKKVAKKVLPIAAPIIGNIIAPGIGGIIASGLTTKLMGGSWGDALKSAALSYGTSALGSGIMSGFNAPAGTSFGEAFTGGLGKGLTAPFSAASNLFSSGPANPFSQGIFGSSGAMNAPGASFMDKVFPRYDPNAIVGAQYNYQPGAIKTEPLAPIADAGDNVGNFVQGGNNASYAQNLATANQVFPDNPTAAESMATELTYGPLGKAPVANVQTNVAGPQAQTTTSALKEGDISPGGNFRAVETLDKAGNIKIGYEPRGFIEKTVGNLTGFKDPLVTKGIGYGALGLGGYGLASATGMLDAPEQEEQFKDLMARGQANSEQIAAYQQWLKLADKNSPEAQGLKLTWYGQPSYTNPQLAAKFGAVPIGPDTGLNIAAAGGGEIVGPGTGTSDSIPARLSDGEFVMTAQAVRNAGGGNRNLGAARMYDMMNRFEKGVA